MPTVWVEENVEQVFVDGLHLYCFGVTLGFHLELEMPRIPVPKSGIFHRTRDLF